MRPTVVDRDSACSGEPAQTEALPILPPRRATGPRTPRGKARSKFNAVKHGIYSRTMLFEGESQSEYKSLLSGLFDEFQPQGTIEESLVEYLGILLWRRRRLLQAERAEIAKASEGWEDALSSRLQIDAEEKNQLAKQEGGLLRFRSNPVVLGLAIEDFERFRELILKDGLNLALGEGILTKLEGRRLEGDHTPDFLQDNCSILQLQNVEERRWSVFSWLREAEATLKSKPTIESTLLEERDARLLEILDQYLEELRHEKKKCERRVYRQAVLDAEASVVLSPQVLDRLIRYDAHFNREFDRTLSQLERLHRMRMGQALPPPIKVDIAS